MRLFLLIAFSLYTAAHLYVFMKAKAAFRFGKRTGILLAFFFVLMIAAPIIVRLCENSDFDRFAIAMSYLGYMWLGGIFFFLWPSLLTDIYRVTIYIGKKVLRSDLKVFTISARTAFIIPLSLSVAISSYAFYEALNIQTAHITIETEKLPPGTDNVRITQISDVHIGLIIMGERLDSILQKVKESNPDILVSTGDLLDGQLDGVTHLTEALRSIKPRLGKYAIAGNHEYIAGIDRALEFTEKAGFTILRQSGAKIADIVTLVGVDDPAFERYNGGKLPSEKLLLSQFPRERFTVLLKHRPDVRPDSINLFDLQLSGHTHGGQIFPFSVITHFYYPNQAGLLRLENGSLYVSRGAGTWGPPIRFLAPPEISVIDIVRKK
jgi:predicted MPP superfamily phosphohydrolase